MNIQNNNIQKLKKRGQYKKISIALKTKILQELKLNNNINELSKQYGISRQTINSFKNSKEHMYLKFKNAMMMNVHNLIDMCFLRYLSLSERKVLKDIKSFIKLREYFDFSEQNSLRNLIPEKKRFSKKKRIIKFILDDALSYYQQKKQQKFTDTFQSVSSKNSDLQTVHQSTQVQEISQNKEFSNDENQLPIWYLIQDESEIFLEDKVSFSEYKFKLY